MNDHTLPIVIMIVEDDPDDVMLTREALEENWLLHDVRSVSDGAELLDYLRQQGTFTPASAPRPHLILLDLNLPKMSGHEALHAIKEDPSLRDIPIVVFTTSIAEEDIAKSYNLGATSFIQKPMTFEGMVHALDMLGTYWFEIVELPAGR